MRGIDHLVLPVRDLDVAAALYQRLGFTVTPKNQHAFGSANRLIQLEGAFLEFLTIDRPERVKETAGAEFSFAAYNRDFLARGEGASMLVLESDDAWRDLAGFEREGLPTFAPFEFSRKAALPDGSEATVGFKLGFVGVPDMPELVLFVCQQLAPQHFWKPEFQTHDNGAVTILDVSIVADDPPALKPVLDVFIGGKGDVSSGDVVWPTRRGRVSVVTPESFLAAYGYRAEAGRIGGMTIGTTNHDTFLAGLDAEGLIAYRNRDRAVIDRDLTFGVSVAFEDMGR